MSFVQPEHPFYRPLYVRLGIVATTAIWAVVEFSANSGFWFTLAVGAFLFTVWTFLITYKPTADKQSEDQQEP